jgi:hypothetical protein
MRQAQRQRAEEARIAAANAPPGEKKKDGKAETGAGAVQGSVAAAGQRAGAYLSSWGSWAAEKKAGWGAKGASSTTATGGGKESAATWKPRVGTYRESAERERAATEKVTAGTSTTTTNDPAKEQP